VVAPLKMAAYSLTSDPIEPAATPEAFTACARPTPPAAAGSVNSVTAPLLHMTGTAPEPKMVVVDVPTIRPASLTALAWA
jgi:hypothetical protein